MFLLPKKDEKNNIVKEIERPNIPFELKDCVVSSERQESEQFKALNEFMSSKKDLKMKTEINKPLTFSVMSIYAKFLKDLGFDDTAQDIQDFKEEYEQYAVSKKRGGRKEFVEMYRNLNQSLQEKEKNEGLVIKK